MQHQHTAPLAARQLEPEVMDGPDLDPQVHEHALAGLARLNRWAGSARIVRGEIGALLARRPGPATLLDVACGAGDVALALQADARRHGWPLTVRGCDRSPVAVAHAMRAARAAGTAGAAGTVGAGTARTARTARTVRAASAASAAGAAGTSDAASAGPQFFVADALAGPPLPAADIVTCSLFVHHLDEAGAVALLARLSAASRHLLLVTDLRRTRAGLALASVAARLATRSPVVHADAPASVRAAFTPDEARQLAQRAGLRDAVVSRVFPQRWLLRWSPA